MLRHWPACLRLLAGIRFYGTVAAIYGCTVLGLVLAATAPARALAHNRLLVSEQNARIAAILRHRPVVHVPQVPIISGRPIRIVIPDSNVDLPVDPGYYNSATDQWTLSGYRAQFAMTSSLANNASGLTFIYGHNNNYVFGALRHHTPAVNAKALLYTDTGHVFTYAFVSTASYAPDDISPLIYNGAPELMIQTCTGSLNEWRTMYRFTFVGVQ